MEPRVTKRDKKLHLSYELPHRIYCSQVYPSLAPNGSTVIIYGHERGIKVLWRAGRRRRTASESPQTNGVSANQEVIVVDGSDDEQADAPKKEYKDEYEDDEDEQDPDCPYSGIVHDLDMELGSAALHLATPTIPATQAPKLAKTHALVAVACANGSLKLLSIPLAPPKDDEDTPRGLSQIDLAALDQPARSLTIKLLPVDDENLTQGRSKSRGPKVEAEILIASVSSTLNVSVVDVTTAAIKKRREPSVSSVYLGSPGYSISFHPSSAYTHLLISDAAGTARIYDPFALELHKDQRSGKWLMSYAAPYIVSSASDSSTARRKKVLSSCWVLGGRGILALLEDGEWGIWDVTGYTQTDKTVGEFTISGFLGTTGEAAEPARSKNPSKNMLAPMTPNTRKTKSDYLFSASSKASSAAPTGGSCVTSGSSKAGQADESVVMWYGDDIYSISSMQQFWQRSMSNSGNLGSLYAPGMTHVSDINLMNENITSISQLSNSEQASSFGQMNVQRDLVVSAEHRLIITQTIRPSIPSRQLFQQAAERPLSHDRDQRMLDVGDLDLGGLNRMLDGRTEDARPRKVGFAS